VLEFIASSTDFNQSRLFVIDSDFPEWQRKKKANRFSPTINSLAEPQADPATFERGLSLGWSRETCQRFPAISRLDCRCVNIDQPSIELAVCWL
jgi:hypothetical protein